MTYQLHPLCTLFPRMSGAEFEALKSDIASNGLRQPIVLHGGMILDGGNRYRACVDAGVDPDFIEFDGGNIVSFVLSANLHRRHMNAGQQAAIVSSAQDWGKAQSIGKPLLRNVAQLDTAKDRASISGASHRTQQMADAVAKKSPVLAMQVAHGEISLPKAHKQIVPPRPLYTRTGPATAPVAVESTELDELRSELAELKASMKETLADNEMMGRAFDADDRVKSAMDEAKRQKAIAENAERTLAAKNGEYIERARAVTHWKNRAEKAEKELAKLKASA